MRSFIYTVTLYSYLSIKPASTLIVIGFMLAGFITSVNSSLMSLWSQSLVSSLLQDSMIHLLISGKTANSDKAEHALACGRLVIDKSLPRHDLSFSVRSNPDILSNSKNKMATAVMPNSKLQNGRLWILEIPSKIHKTYRLKPPFKKISWYLSFRKTCRVTPL